jgi:hypothetical protein
VSTPSGRRVESAWRTGQPKRLDKPVTEYFLVDGKFEPRVYNTGYPAVVGVSHWPEQGAYVVAYQSVASDGEAVKGTLRFTYSGPATPPPAGWTAPTAGPPEALTRALSGPSAAPATSAPLLSDAGNAPAPQAQSPAAKAPFVLTDWLIPAVVIAAVGFMVLAAARRAPAAPHRKRRRA